MNIQTERCVIRNFEAGDIPRFMEFRNNARWMRYQGYKAKTKKEHERDLLGDVSLAEGGQFAIVSAATGRLIGDIYLKQAGAVYWLGYAVHPACSRQGYVAEAVIAVIRWVAEHGAAAVKAGVLPGNTASVRLLEKLHFTCMGREGGEAVYVYEIAKQGMQGLEDTEHFAYLLRCADGSLYAGWTNDLTRRLAAHNAGKGAKYTRGRHPVALAWAQGYPTQSQAMGMEARLKRMPKAAKEALVLEWQGRTGE